MMREAYLVNSSHSITSIPLYEKLPISKNGREIQRLQYKKLVPGEEFVVGVDIPVEKKKFYSQFQPIKVELKFREAKHKPEDIKVEEPPKDDKDLQEGSKPEEHDAPKGDKPEVVQFTEDELKKKRQAELIEICNGLGLEATAQESKAEIIKKILEKISIG